MGRSIDLEELVEHWTLLDDERDTVAGKPGAARLGFVLLLKFYNPGGDRRQARGGHASYQAAVTRLTSS